MAAANSSGAPSRVDHLSSPLSRADIAAHRASSYVRSVPAAHAGDSDPNPDEALRRVREHGSALRDGMAAYHEWAAGAAA